MTIIRSIKDFTRELSLIRKLNIGPEDIVLDVGSGQNPHPRANVLCDKFIEDNTERACGGSIVVDRPFVLGDGLHLPFQDKAFDFVFCRHLLEHVEDPARLLSELERVGRRGYIETPSKLYEKLYGNDYHRWFVSVQNGSLILERKPRPYYDNEISQWFHSHVDTGTETGLYYLDHLATLGFLIQLAWSGSIPYRYLDVGESPEGEFRHALRSGDFSKEPVNVMTRISLRSRIKTSVARSLRRRSDRRIVDFSSLLRCPECGGGVQQGPSQGMICVKCRREFPVRGFVVFMPPKG